MKGCDCDCISAFFSLRVGMMRFSSLILATILQGCVDARMLDQRDSNSTFNVLDYVDPLIGTANGGSLASKRALDSERF